MERFNYRAGEDLGAVARVFDLPKACERVSLLVVLGAMRVLRASEACAVRRMRGGAAPDHHGYLARVAMELLASARIWLPLKLRVCLWTTSQHS